MKFAKFRMTFKTQLRAHTVDAFKLFEIVSIDVIFIIFFQYMLKKHLIKLWEMSCSVFLNIEMWFYCHCWGMMGTSTRKINVIFPTVTATVISTIDDNKNTSLFIFTLVQTELAVECDFSL